MNFLHRISPLTKDLSNYSASIFTTDVIAGLTVGIMLIPQGMAYAILAGLPPIYGLYGGVIPLLLYALFGSSRQLSIGPVAISSILLAEGISKIAEPFSAEFVSYAIAAGLMIGVVQLLFGLLKMGFLVNFLSQPIIVGFTSAAAIIIIGSQLSDLLGFKIPRFSHFYETILYAIQHIQETNWLTLGMCFSAIAIMLGLKRINRMIPGALIVVMLGTILCYVFDLPSYGVAIVGTVPEGLPIFELPDLSLSTMEQLIPTVLTVAIIGIVECIGIAKAIEAKHQNYSIQPNQELFAIGISKIGGAFFQALPTSGSFTRSAINNEAGAKTTIASLITVLILVLTLLFLTPVFYYLPKAMLAAIILLAVRNLIEHKIAKHLWYTHRRDFVVMLVTFIGTLALGIKEGILIGILLSFMTVLYLSSKPNIITLGRVPNTTYYRDVERLGVEEQEEGLLILRFENQLFFANAAYFKDEVKACLTKTKRPINCVIIDAKSIHDMDSSGVASLREVHIWLKNKGIELYFCGTVGTVQDILEKTGFIKEIGESHCFTYLHDGIEYWKSRF